MADAGLDTSAKLAMLLASLGSSLQNAGAQGRGVWSGLSGGVNDYFGGLGAMQKYQDDQAERAQMLAYHKAQADHLDAQTQLERQKQEQEAAAIRAYTGGGYGGMTAPGAPTTPGMAAPPSTPMIGPGPISPNNPGNIIDGRGGFRVYDTPDAGIAALIRNAQAYPAAFNGGQPMTIAQIGQHWAPKDDKGTDPVLWARAVASISGLPADQPIDLTNPQTAMAFARGVHGIEKGQGAAFEPAVYQRGVQLALGGVPASGAPSPVQPAQASVPDLTSTTFGDARPPLPTMQPPQPVTPQAPAAPPDSGPPLVPRPTQVPPEVKAQLQRMVATRQLTIPQAVAEENKYLDTLWQQQQQNARAAWEFNRSAGTVRQMTPEEVQARGLNPRGVYQLDREGNVKVVQAPQGFSVQTLGDGNTYLVDTMRPDAKPVPLGPPKQPDSKEVDQVRGQVEKLPAVLNLGRVVPSFNSMIRSSQLNDKAADLDLIVGLAKILDPDSVVREGESEMVRKTGGIFDVIQGWQSGVLGGSNLTAEQRRKIMQIAASRVGELKSAADAAMQPYFGIAKDRGWKVEHIMPGLPSLSSFDPKMVAGAGTEPAAQPKLPVMNTPEEALSKLKPGDEFQTPDGRVLRVPQSRGR